MLPNGAIAFDEALKISSDESFSKACIGGTGFILGLFFIMVAFLTGASVKEVDKEKDKKRNNKGN
jgi:hypothetical protein